MTVTAFLNEHFARANTMSQEVYVSYALACAMTSAYGDPSKVKTGISQYIAGLRFYVIWCAKGWVIVSRD